MVTKDDIKKALSLAGLKAGDTAIVHSSLKAFGQVESGPDTVIDALIETADTSGTLVLPTFTLSMQMKDNNIFDMANSKSEVGIITEVFRKRAGILRSEHLVHSVAASGKKAQEALGDGILPCGKGSPFEFLLRENAWNLFLGAGMTSCTALHMIEEYMGVPYRHYREYPGSFVIHPDGTKTPTKAKEYVKYPGFKNDFEKIEGIFAKAGLLNYAKAGEAKIIAARMKPIFEFIKKQVTLNPFFLVRKEA